MGPVPERDPVLAIGGPIVVGVLFEATAIFGTRAVGTFLAEEAFSQVTGAPVSPRDIPDILRLGRGGYRYLKRFITEEDGSSNPQRIMEILTGVPMRVLSRRRFEILENVPDQPGIYAIIDRENGVGYVGSSGDSIAWRITQETHYKADDLIHRPNVEIHYWVTNTRDRRTLEWLETEQLYDFDSDVYMLNAQHPMRLLQPARDGDYTLSVEDMRDLMDQTGWQRGDFIIENGSHVP